MTLSISVTRHATDGFTLSTVVGNRLIRYRYIGYSVKEAKQLFRQYIRASLNQI